MSDIGTLVRPAGELSLSLNGRALTGPVAPTKMRIALGLWGDCGCGKTTLAATAPGIKLWIQFDSDGTLSLAGRNDILLYDVSADTHHSMVKFDTDNPLGLDTFLKDNPQVETVVIDSVTAFTYLGLQHAVAINKNSSMREPGKHGYGQRNGIIQRSINAMIQITAKYNRHVIFIMHEAGPNMDDEGRIIDIPMAVNKGVANHLGIRLNEIWHMIDNGKERRIAVRPCRQRKPMKSRMFDTGKDMDFMWRYSPTTMEGGTIAGWFNAWRDGNGAKLALPK